MRRKLICLMLCLLMAMSTVAFTACGESEDDSTENAENNQTSARAAVSINMWVVCEKPVDAETELQVEDALNSLTESKYTTHVDLKFYTEDEYFEALDAELENAANIKASNAALDMPILVGSFDDVADETVEETIIEETEIGEYGEKKIVYPEIEDGQVDIVFLAGEELLERYVSEGKILSLEEKLNSSDAKVLKDYIYPSAINQIKVNNGGSVAQAYAIPNNTIIGEYTYLLVNKEMAEKYYIDVDNINTFADCADLINDIAKNESDIAPVLAYANPVNVEYWLDFTADKADSAFTFAVGSTDASVFGVNETLPAAPVASGNSVMVPLEFFSEALDAGYAFKAATSTATITYGTRIITVTVDSANATVNGETVRLSAAAYTDDETGKVMIPVDFLAENLCATVVYDEADQQYVIEPKDFGGLSLLASYIQPDATLGDYSKMDSAFAIPEFTDHMLLMQKCEDNGWFADDPENTEDFGVAIVTGAYETMADYSDKYEVKVLSYPMLDDEDVYDAMFAVTAYTVDLSRSLEVLTLIYTDEEAKNVLQYGVEGVHYEFDDEGNFVIISDKYCMNNNYTGNAFLAYTTADMPADIWDNAKATNLDSRVYPFFGMDDAWTGVGANHISGLRNISNVFFDRMEECDNSTELAAFFAEAQAIIDEYQPFQTAIGNVPEVDPDSIIPGDEIEVDNTTPYAIYSQWGATNWTDEAKSEAAAVEAAMKEASEETAAVTAE